MRKFWLASLSAAAVVLPLATSANLATASPAPAAAGAIPASSTTAGAVEKSSTGTYIVMMKADPLIRQFEPKDLGSAPAKAKKNQLIQSHAAAARKANVPAKDVVQEYTNALNGFTVKADLDEANRLAKLPEVALVLPDELRQPAADTASLVVNGTSLSAGRISAAKDSKSPVDTNRLYDFLGLTGKKDAWAKGITGEGVTVGVIDTGIWPEHPSFADDGTYPDAPALAGGADACAFGNSAHNPADAPFECNNKLVGARVVLDTYRAVIGLEDFEFDSARDNEGHGTHTASTAAGNADIDAEIFGAAKGTTSGIAPRAHVIAYKALGDLGGFTSDLTAAIDQAVADGVDVINYSIGGGAGIVSADTIAFLFASDAGVLSAVSAGNNGPGSATIGGPADVPWVTAVGANTHPTLYEGWIEAGDLRIRGASVTEGVGPAPMVDAADAGNELCLANTLDEAKVAGSIVLCKRGASGRIAKSFEVQRAGGVGMILFNASDDDTLFTDNFFVPTVMIDYTPGSQLKDWVASTSDPVGSLVAGGLGTSFVPSPTMAYFSSRGENPTAGDIIKPDLTAPGVQIMAGNTPMPSPGTQPAGELFQAIAGTSMSSPVVAGSFALLRQANPDWGQAAAKSALMTTADTQVLDNDRESPATPFAQGAGMARVGAPAAKGSAFRPGLVYDAGFLEYLGFLCAEGREAFANADATCGALASAGIPTEAADLNLASIGIEAVPGSATVTRTVTSVADRAVEFNATITSPPPGYTVSVSPPVINLDPGESASFTVTITNTGSAPVGEWRFGSFAWKGGGYSVSSPIAVKGVDIAVPATLTGSGTTGSATIPVDFGFSGPYTATAEGLVPTTHFSGVISQDPDQTYPSADDGAGVVEVPFTLSGVGVARWALTLPGADDLDLYLRGPGGNIVATSTRGATDELIELHEPADGQYTMVVHGWAVGAPNTAFDLRSWLVPIDDGAGSLTVSSGASTIAVIGTTHEVGIEWSGLVADETYLGAVTHRNDGTVLARTVVTVTG